MKEVITALANPKLNKKLKQMNKFIINYNDIQYQEGVLEILKENKKIDILILSEILPGEYKIEDFILEIKKYNKKIKIIIFLEYKKEKLEIFLKSQGIFNIYYNNEIKEEKIIQEINKTDKNKSVELINKVIKDNLRNNKKRLKKINLFKRKNIFKKFYKKENLIKNNNFKNKIITISGTSGVGKSIFTINLALSFKNKKILIIDLDILNNCIHTILGIKKNIENNKDDLNNYITKYNNNLDIITISNLLENNIFNFKEVEEFFNKFKKIYDYILIDISNECFWNQNKKIIEKSFLNLFLVEANLIEIKKSKRILEIYNKEWKIEKSKTKIIFNKYNNNSIKEKILKKLFIEYKILGKIDFNLYYNFLINKNYKCKKELNKIKNEYSKIIKYI